MKFGVGIGIGIGIGVEVRNERVWNPYRLFAGGCRGFDRDYGPDQIERGGGGVVGELSLVSYQ